MFNAILDPSNPASPLSVAPHETAVLLIDYQNMVLMKIGDAAATSVLNVASQLRLWALERGMCVFHCLLDTSPGTRPPRYAKAAAKWMSYEDVLVENPELGREAYALKQRVSPDRETSVTRIPGFLSALKSNGLIDALTAKGIRSLIMGGVSTSGCVLSTARAAPDRGFITTVVEDACFDPTPGLHGILVAHTLPMNAHVTTSRELQDAWKVL